MLHLDFEARVVGASEGILVLDYQVLETLVEIRVASEEPDDLLGLDCAH